MAELTDRLNTAGFENIRSYIQSGNILFHAGSKDCPQLAMQISQLINQYFNLQITVVVISKSDWRNIMRAAPQNWGKATNQKHNLLILVPPYDRGLILASIEPLDMNVETITAGEGVLYQSMSLELIGVTTTSKLKTRQMTVRSYTTALKLLSLL